MAELSFVPPPPPPHPKIDQIVSFIKQVQAERNTPCVLHFIDLDLELVDLYNDDQFQFQYYSQTPAIQPELPCNILITHSEFVRKAEAMDLEKSLKHQMWIVLGQYQPDDRYAWPVLEVQPSISRLYCPAEDKPRLILSSPFQTCPDYPTLNGQAMKVSLLGLPSDYRQLPNGKFVGYYPETIELLSSYLDFHPQFQVAVKTNDDSVLVVQNGSMDLGVHITISRNRLDKTDMPSYIDYEELVYIVPVPKPVDVFYQLLQPFSMTVWFTWLGYLLFFCLLFYLTTKLLDQNLQVDVSWIDFALYPIGITIQPLVETQWIRKIWSKTVSGACMTGTLIIAGFLVMELYKQVLLSHLTTVSFEKPIDTVQELVDSDWQAFHFQDENILQILKNSLRKDLQNMYAKVMKNNWIADNKNISIARKRIYKGQDSLLVNTQPLYWLSTKQIKTIGKPLHRRFKDPLLLSARSLVLPKNGPLTPTFGKFITRAVDTGLFQKIKYKEIIKEDLIALLGKPKSQDSTPQPLNLKPFYAILFLIAGLYLVSFICFLLEVITSKCVD